MKHFCLPRLGRFHAAEHSRGLACRERRDRLPRAEGERKVHSSAAPLSSAAGQRTRARRVQPHQRRRRYMDVLLPCTTRDAPFRVAPRTPSLDSRTHENACRLVYLAGGIYACPVAAAATANVSRHCLTRESTRVLEFKDLRIINN